MGQMLRPESAIATKVFPSPNHGDRKDGKHPRFLILHYTGMTDSGEALQWLANAMSQVSAHYFVFEDGRVLQMVPEARRAWHAGVSFWDGETDINSASIGIEIANAGHPGGLPPFPDAQIDSVSRLAKDIAARWRIPAHHVLGHSDVAPGRKVDPGEAFPWQALHAAGVGHFVAPAQVRDGRFFARGDRGMPIEALQAMLSIYGYRARVTGHFDEDTEKIVAAFQRHFRPERVDGVADSSTITTLRDLIASRPPVQPADAGAAATIPPR